MAETPGAATTTVERTSTPSAGAARLPIFVVVVMPPLRGAPQAAITASRPESGGPPTMAQHALSEWSGVNQTGGRPNPAH